MYLFSILTVDDKLIEPKWFGKASGDTFEFVDGRILIYSSIGIKNRIFLI